MQSIPKSGLTLIPPSPVSHLTPVQIRAGVTNDALSARELGLSVYLDQVDKDHCLYSKTVTVAAQSTHTENFQWEAGAKHAGQHEIILVVTAGNENVELRRPLLIVESPARSLDIIAGAFSGFVHWSEKEGRLWNQELKNFTEDDWRKLVQAQYELGMNIMVPQECFRHQEYVGEHRIEADGYQGEACYSSRLFPRRMQITTQDPLEITLDEADKLNMQVFVPVGMYAWFDFTPGSLEWHKNVASELWSLYGHHDSFYGWYVSEEIAGDLGTDDQRREELVHFFQEFTRHCRSLAPEKPVMLASNCHYIRKGLDYYPAFLQNLDILCPFGFQRMPQDDLTASEAAELLQELCDKSNAHLWLDMEAFNFHSDMALYPRPIDELITELHNRSYFEKIICYQFPGMFNPPWAAKQPGGPDTVQLFNDYKKYITDTLPAIVPSPLEAAAPHN